MKAVIHGTEIELEPNSKPYLLKRILADGFDTVLIFALFSLFTMLLLRTPAAAAYHSHFEACRAIEAETRAALAGDARAIAAALSTNALYQSERFAANLNAYFFKAAACLLAELAVLLAVPLADASRSTPGKLMAGIMPFNEQRQSRATRVQIFYRFLFVFLIDSLALYLLTGVLTFLLVPILRLSEMLLNGKKNKTLCDLITGITIIEKLSYDGINSIRGGN